MEEEWSEEMREYWYPSKKNEVKNPTSLKESGRPRRKIGNVRSTTKEDSSFVDSSIKQTSDDKPDIKKSSISIELNSKNMKIETEEFIDEQNVTNDKIESKEDFDSNNIFPMLRTLLRLHPFNKEYKLTSLRILITYKDVHLDKRNILEHVTNIVTSRLKNIQEYLIVHDTYGKSIYTHVFIKLNEALFNKNRATFDFQKVSSNTERVLHFPKYLDSIFTYLLERDPDPLTNIDKSKFCLNESRQMSNETNIVTNMKDDVKMLSSERDISYENEDLLESWEFKPWQKYLLNVIDEKVDPRGFYWCWDIVGKMGKTKLANFITNNNENVLLINVLGNLEYLINTYISYRKINKINCVIFDLPREITEIENTNLCNFIRILKDEYIGNLPLSNMVRKLDPCHVIVFANFIPNIKKLSSDRWNIIRILKDGSACLDSVNDNGEIVYNESCIAL